MQPLLVTNLVHKQLAKNHEARLSRLVSGLAQQRAAAAIVVEAGLSHNTNALSLVSTPFRDELS